jgi:hypothetical protein
MAIVSLRISITHALTDCGLRQSRCFSHACLYRVPACETTKALKIKRNNVNHYAWRRINASARICTVAETEY